MIGTWTVRTCHSRWDRRSGHAGLATPAVVVVIIFTVIGRLGIMDGGLRVTLRDMLGIIVRIFSVLTPSMTSIWSSRYLLSTWRNNHNHNGQSSKSPWVKDSAPQGHSWESRSARGPARAPHPTNSPPELLLHLNLIDNISAPKSAYLYWWFFSRDLALNDRRPIKDLDACDLWDCGPLVPAPRLLGFSRKLTCCWHNRGTPPSWLTPSECNQPVQPLPGGTVSYYLLSRLLMHLGVIESNMEKSTDRANFRRFSLKKQ